MRKKSWSTGWALNTVYSYKQEAGGDTGQMEESCSQRPRHAGCHQKLGELRNKYSPESPDGAWPYF